MVVVVFFFQAEDGIRDLVRSRGLGDVYKRQKIGIANDDQRRLVGAVEAALYSRLNVGHTLTQHLSLIHI